MSVGLPQNSEDCSCIFRSTFRWQVSPVQLRINKVASRIKTVDITDDVTGIRRISMVIHRGLTGRNKVRRVTSNRETDSIIMFALDSSNADQKTITKITKLN